MSFITTRRRCARFRWAAGVCLLATGAAAQGQNSLWRQSQRPISGGEYAPTTQPAARQVPVLRGLPPVKIRSAHAADPFSEAQNPELLRVSPIAVEAPEPEEIQVHDLVTIIVREIKASSSKAKLKSEKEWTLEAELKKWFRLGKNNNLVVQSFPDGTPGADFEFKNEYEGEGKVDRRDTLTTRITARVIDVKPNGTLALEATNTVKVDEEKYVITLTGTCRSEDVSAQNTVLSTQIHGLQIDIQHHGAARDAARRGWLMRAFDFLRPF